MKKLVIVISLIFIITIITAFKLPSQTPKSIPENKSQKTINLIHHKNHYFIRVKLNNRTANLLVDTGAAASLLDITQAKHYQFSFYKTDHTFNGIGGLTNGYRVTKYTIEHDSTALPIYPFGIDMEHVNDSFKENGMPIVGVLGSDFLRKSEAIIDYKNMLLTINY